MGPAQHAQHSTKLLGQTLTFAWFDRCLSVLDHRHVSNTRLLEPARLIFVAVAVHAALGILSTDAVDLLDNYGTRRGCALAAYKRKISTFATGIVQP